MVSCFTAHHKLCIPYQLVVRRIHSSDCIGYVLNKRAVHIYMYYYGYYSILTSLYYLLAFNFCSYSDRNPTAKMARRKPGEDLEQDMHQSMIRGHRVYRELEPFYRRACTAAQSMQRQLQGPCHRYFCSTPPEFALSGIYVPKQRCESRYSVGA